MEALAEAHSVRGPLPWWLTTAARLFHDPVFISTTATARSFGRRQTARVPYAVLPGRVARTWWGGVAKLHKQKPPPPVTDVRRCGTHTHTFRPGRRRSFIHFAWSLPSRRITPEREIRFFSSFARLTRSIVLSFSVVLACRHFYYGRTSQRNVRQHGGGSAAERQQPGRPENR